MVSARTQSGHETRLKALYDEQGYLGPLSTLAPGEVRRLDVVPLIQSLGSERGWQRNRHLDVPEIAEVCRSSNVIAHVRALLGPDLLVWRSNVFAVSSRERGFIWHQDEYRTLIECPNDEAHCSVQLNFSDATRRNCVAIVPGSHRWGTEEFRRRGCELVPGSEGGAYGARMWSVPRSVASRSMRLKAGQFYIFHPRLLHASVQNRVTTRLAGWMRERSAGLRRRDPVRYSIALRIATPAAKVLPAAFAESPSRTGCVILSGTHEGHANPLTTWAT